MNRTQAWGGFALSVGLILNVLIIPPAEAKGCLAGAAAGAAVGHHLHHTLIGAATGCYLGHKAAKAYQHRQERLQEQRDQQRMQEPRDGGEPNDE